MSTLSSPLAFVLLDLDSAGHSAAEDLLDDSGEGTTKSLFFPYLSNHGFFLRPNYSNYFLFSWENIYIFYFDLN